MKKSKTGSASGPLKKKSKTGSASGRAPGLFTLLVLAITAASSSCKDYGGTSTFACPSKSVFTGDKPEAGAPIVAVSAFLERRCGTLDCHGSAGRPLRLHGQYGLRDPGAANVSGGGATTEAELDMNYAAVCAVEPEKAQDVVDSSGASAEKLLIVTKARGLEGHKGGTILKQGSPGDRCLVGWLAGQSLDQVGPACQQALDQLGH